MITIRHKLTLFRHPYRLSQIKSVSLPRNFKSIIMAHRLNTNKQFMIGNGILAFAVIFIVVVFVYMSMRLQRNKETDRHFIETYTVNLTKGFVGDSLSLFINDSLIMNKQISEEPVTVEIGRFAEESALMIVDNITEQVSVFDLSEKGGNYRFEKDTDGIKQLAR